MRDLLREILLNNTPDPKIDFSLDMFKVTSYKQGYHFKTHCHKRVELIYVLRGSCMMIIENELVSLTKENSIFVFPYTNHDFQVHSGGGVKIVQLEFTLDKQEAHSSGSCTLAGLHFLNRLSEGMKFIKIPNNPEIRDCMERIIRENRMIQENSDTLNKLYFLELDILLSRYVSKMSKTDKEFENNCIKQGIEIIHKEYCSEIKVNHIAAECGVSERYFRKLFKKYMESTPHDYCNNLRISKAVELLSNRRIPIKEIAYSVGYSTPQYFCRAFKKAYGLTPQKYRNIFFAKIQ
ncbi:MAG: helix-turn-helix domain-containing protein [Mangrovibacterium sp.]